MNKNTKSIKKNLIVCTVVCLVFLMLSVGLIQPIQATETIKTKPNTSIDTDEVLAALSDVSLDVQQTSENIFIVSAGNVSITVEFFEKGHRFSAVSEDNEVTTYEITTELRPVSNTAFSSSSKNNEPFQRVSLINGTALSQLPEIKPTNQSAEYADEPFDSEDSSGTRGVAEYMWDGICFDASWLTMEYQHPSRSVNFISPYSDWVRTGYDLYHYQIKSSTVAGFFGGASGVAEVLIAAGIGAIIGSVVGAGTGALAGAVVGACLSGYFIWQVYEHFIDEAGCIWWWLDKGMMAYILDNAYYLASGYAGAILMFDYYFLAGSFLRVGDWTVMDSLHIGDPPPFPEFAVYIADSDVWVKGDIINPYALCGETNDGIFTEMIGPNVYDGAYIVCALNKKVTTSGSIKIYGHAGSGANTRVYTYVSNTYNGGWRQTSFNVVSGTNDRWINCGSGSDFSYLVIAVLHESSGYRADLFIDSIKVSHS